MESSLELIEGRWATGPLAAPLLWFYTSSSASQSYNLQRKKITKINNFLSHLPNCNYLRLETEISCCWNWIHMYLIVFWVTPFTPKSDVTVLVLVNINILDLVTHERKKKKSSCFVEHLRKRGALGFVFQEEIERHLPAKRSDGAMVLLHRHETAINNTVAWKAWITNPPKKIKHKRN